MQHQDGLISRREPLAGGLEVTGQDIPLIHPLVSEEAIRSLGIRPVLTGHWDTLPGPIRQLLKQRPEALSQTLIHEGTFLNLLVDPAVWRLLESNSAPPAPRRRQPIAPYKPKMMKAISTTSRNMTSAGERLNSPSI
jgi:hypothetical protein